MDNCLVSIIIPTFNSEKTLIRCLDSILYQKFKSYEVLIIDSCSTDRTLEIAESYLGRLPCITIKSEPDGGIYDAMNKGIVLANGEWLYFLGSDDRLYSDLVLQQVFESNDYDSILLIYGKASITPNNTITEIDFTFERLIEWNICHQAIFYSRKVFESNRYRLSYTTLADWDLNFKIFARHSHLIRCYDLIICEYSNEGTSSNWDTGREYLKYFSSPLKIFFRYLSFWRAILTSWRYYNDHGWRKLTRFRTLN